MMNTYIALGIFLCLSLALLLRDTLATRRLRGSSIKENLAHQYDYELGFYIVFKKLPSVNLFCKWRLGNLGTLCLLYLFMYGMCLLASIADGTLTLAGDDSGLLEDYAVPLTLFATVAVFYLFRRIMDFVPDALTSISKASADSESTQDSNKVVDRYLKTLANFLFQTQLGRNGRWLAFDVGIGVLFAALVVTAHVLEVIRPAEYTEWNDPPYVWGNTVSILLFTIFGTYFARIAIGYLARLIWAMWHLGKTLYRKRLLQIRPLDPDGAGGLGKFGALAWRIDVFLLPLLLVLIVTYFSNGVDILFISVSVFCMVAIPVFFFVPLWGFHQGMAAGKRDELQALSDQFNRNAADIKRCLHGDSTVQNEAGRTSGETLESIISLYDRASRMPVWPFSLNTLLQVTAYFLIPLLPLIADLALG